jgi:hypothetical protein
MSAQQLTIDGGEVATGRTSGNRTRIDPQTGRPYPRKSHPSPPSPDLSVTHYRDPVVGERFREGERGQIRVVCRVANIRSDGIAVTHVWHAPFLKDGTLGTMRTSHGSEVWAWIAATSNEDR